MYKVARFVVVGVEHVDDAGVVDGAGSARLAEKTLGEFGVVLELRVKHLDRDLAAKNGVFGGEDPPHSAFAEQSRQAIPAAKNGADLCACRGHESPCSCGDFANLAYG